MSKGNKECAFSLGAQASRLRFRKIVVTQAQARRPRSRQQTLFFWKAKF